MARPTATPLASRFGYEAILLAIIAVVFAAYALTLPGFLTVQNLVTMVRNVSTLGMLALGMAVVVIGRGIDISQIAAMTVPTGLLLVLAGNGLPPAAAALMALLLALAIGLSNGLLIAYGDTPALLTTLATGIFWAGIGQLFVFELDIVSMPTALAGWSWLGRGDVLGLPWPVILFLASAVVFHLFLTRTTWGMFVFALGDNPATARVTGLPVRASIVMQYCMVAVFAAFAGIVLAASVDTINARLFSSNLIYEVLLVVVLGGIGLSGGRGGVVNVILGTFLIGLFLNGLTIMDVSYPVQRLVTGLILLVALAADTLLHPRDEQTGQTGDI